MLKAFFCTLLLLVRYSYQSCNPLQDSTCLVHNPGLGQSFTNTFSSPSDNFTSQSTPSGVEYCENGLRLTLKKRFDNPSLTSKFYILHGKVEVELKAAKGQGVVSSCYLQSDDLDEIDITEVFGGNPYEFQTNFFVKGNTSNYDRGGYHHTPTSPIDGYLKYGVEWTPEKLTWFVNDNPVRTVDKDNKHGYPSSPMQVKFSLWAGGDPGNLPGTIQWAGGLTRYEEAPFMMYVRKLHVVDFSNSKDYIYGNGPQGWVELGVSNEDMVAINKTSSSKATIPSPTFRVPRVRRPSFRRITRRLGPQKTKAINRVLGTSAVAAKTSQIAPTTTLPSTSSLAMDKTERWDFPLLTPFRNLPLLSFDAFLLQNVVEQPQQSSNHISTSLTPTVPTWLPASHLPGDFYQHVSGATRTHSYLINLIQKVGKIWHE